jgi:hypothetical protein
VPSIEPGAHDLMICPCRDDWFAFHVDAGDLIRATATFSNAAIDLDLRLYAGEPNNGGTGAQVATSMTTGDTEQISYSAPEAGVYFLRVYPYNDQAHPRGAYRLTIP